MTATFNWIISALDCSVPDGGEQAIVKTVHWRCEGSETVGDKTCSGSIYGTCSLPFPDGEVTDYAALKKEQVLGWVWGECIDKDATEAIVQAQINGAKIPPIVQPALPWDTESEAQ